MPVSAGFVDAFRANLARIVAARVDGPEAHARVATIARARVAAVARTKGVTVWNKIVDGDPGAPEEKANLRGGKIVYAFPQRTAAIRFMLAYAKEHSPERSGAYAEAWFLVVDGRPWTGSIDDIPASAEVMLTNFAPYARRLEEGYEVRTRIAGVSYATSKRIRRRKYDNQFVGARSRYLITEKTRQAMLSRFPDLDIQRTYVAIPGSPGGSARGWPVPWMTRSGEPVLYPAVVIAGSR